MKTEITQVHTITFDNFEFKELNIAGQSYSSMIIDNKDGKLFLEFHIKPRHPKSKPDFIIAVHANGKIVMHSYDYKKKDFSEVAIAPTLFGPVKESDSESLH